MYDQIRCRDLYPLEYSTQSKERQNYAFILNEQTTFCLPNFR